MTERAAMKTEIILSLPRRSSPPRCSRLASCPKAERRVLEFFTAQVNPTFFIKRPQKCDQRPPCLHSTGRARTRARARHAVLCHILRTGSADATNLSATGPCNSRYLAEFSAPGRGRCRRSFPESGKDGDALPAQRSLERGCQHVVAVERQSMAPGAAFLRS